MPAPNDSIEQTSVSPEHSDMLDAMAKVLAPLAQICVDHGLNIQTVAEALRCAYVRAGLAVHQTESNEASPPQRLTSRISASTGLTRREVTRLLQQSHQPPVAKPSIANEVFTKWVSDPAFKDAKGQPVALPRQGVGCSFETLVQAVTTDVHPRAILQELVRLGMVQANEEDQTVSLRQQAFVPRGDQAKMMQFFGDNLGDHLQAACENLLSDGRQHLEQAVFADELSEHSVKEIQPTLTQIWQDMLTQLSQEFTRLIEEDRKHQRVQDQRMRVGMFSLHQKMQHVPEKQ